MFVWSIFISLRRSNNEWVSTSGVNLRPPYDMKWFKRQQFNIYEYELNYSFLRYDNSMIMIQYQYNINNSGFDDATESDPILYGMNWFIQQWFSIFVSLNLIQHSPISVLNVMNQYLSISLKLLWCNRKQFCFLR